MEGTATVRVDDRGRVVIPQPLREKLEIESGSVVEVEVRTD